jgi:hypothetical protein
MGKSNRFKLSKEDSLNLFLRVLAMIKSKRKGFFKMEKLRGDLQGYCDYEDNVISIDYRKELIPTLIHECIHYIEPDWCETKVIYAEKMVIKYIEPEDCVCLLLIFSKKF